MLEHQPFVRVAIHSDEWITLEKLALKAPSGGQIILFSTQSIKPNDRIFFMYRRPVGSVGWASDYRAGGCGFKHRPDQHSGSFK